MKQIFLASTFFELVCLAAGIDSGAYDSVAAPALLGTGGVATSGEHSANDSDRERILLVSNNAAVLELSRSITDTPGAAGLIERFDRVLDLNAAVTPEHPSSWKPAQNDLPMVEAHLRSLWDLGEEKVELVLESPQVNPAIALGRVFSSATIRVHADGLMSYGPTRNHIPLTNGQRMSTLHYLPLVPGLVPRLLTEFGIVPQPMEPEYFREVIREIGDSAAAELDSVLDEGDQEAPWALAVGQYLAALGLISDEEETALHVDMIKQAASRGMTRVVFKPHPAAPPTQLDPLFTVSEEVGVKLSVLDIPVLAEVIIDRLHPSLIVGGFSTALATAQTIYGVPALAVGMDMLLNTVKPYQNSNRIPLTIIAELCDGIDSNPESKSPELSRLVETVSYCMAPQVSRDLRSQAEEYLSHLFEQSGNSRARRYFKAKRLTSLQLPVGRTAKTVTRRTIRQTGVLALLAARRQQRRIADRAKSWTAS